MGGFLNDSVKIVRGEVTMMVRSIAAFCFLFVLIGISGFKPAYAVTLELCKDRVDIDFNYHGERLFLKGIVDNGSDLIVKVVSIDQHPQILRKKGRVAGVIWMNVGEILFSNVPDFYEVWATRSLEEILTPEEAAKYGLGYQALLRQSSLLFPEGDEVDGAEKERLFREFIKYKESAQLYSVGTGHSADLKKAKAAFSLGVADANASLSPLQTTGFEGKTNYSFVFEWPYQAKPGTYRVTVYEVKDKKVIGQAEDTFTVKEVGFVDALVELSNKHGAIYGIIAILASIGAGFGVGAVFRKGGGAH